MQCQQGIDDLHLPRYPMGWEKEKMYQVLAEGFLTSCPSDRLLDRAGGKYDVVLTLKRLHLKLVCLLQGCMNNVCSLAAAQTCCSQKGKVLMPYAYEASLGVLQSLFFLSSGQFG